MSEYAKVCEEAARAGGAAIQAWRGRFEVRMKGPADLVTQADLASQKAIQEIVLGAFPDHDLLGEEGPPPIGTPRAEYRWIADPLDGTTNFVHGVPRYAVSLALERHGELLVGAIYDPVRDECYTAAAGEGAFLDGRPIRTSTVQSLADALGAVGFPPRPEPDCPDLLVFLEAIGSCQAVRRTGSTALNLCDLAAGRFDVYWSYAAKIWDVAAGVLLVREAGGTLTSPVAAPLSWMTPSSWPPPTPRCMPNCGSLSPAPSLRVVETAGEGPCGRGAMLTLAVGMRRSSRVSDMPTASVGMAPAKGFPQRETNLRTVSDCVSVAGPAKEGRIAPPAPCREGRSANRLADAAPHPSVEGFSGCGGRQLGGNAAFRGTPGREWGLALYLGSASN